MRSSHKQDKYLLEQAYANLREKVNPYDVLDKIRESEDGTLNDILGGALNTFDISYDSEELIQYIADEMKKAGYTSEVIKDITGIESIDPEEVVENQFKVGDEVIMTHDTPWGTVGFVDEIDGDFLSVIDQKGKYHEVHVSQVKLY